MRHNVEFKHYSPTERVRRLVEESMANIERYVRHLPDDGRGITDAERSTFGSLGLLGMRERARLLGGELTIRGIPGRGTTIAVRVPLAATASG